MKLSLRFKHYVVLFLVILAGYHTFFIYSLQYDFLDCWLPWRHFISKSFHNGILPLWNPYQQLGYPIFADLQGPLYSLENFITGNLFALDLSTLQYILFGYIVFAGIGMYELGRYLFKNSSVALIIACAYALSGFFTHHTQHMFSIISAACLPATLLFILKFLQHPQWKYIFALAVLFHLQFTGGNQTFNLLNFHVFAFLFIAKIVHLYKEKNPLAMRHLFKRSFALIIFIVLTILPVLIAWYQTKDLVSRYDGLSYEKSVGNSMTLVALQSLINPFISGQPVNELKTDPSMAAHFFGFVLLLCSIGFFIFSKNKLKWIFLFCIALFTLLSLGNLTPVHHFFFKIDPLLQLFRFPAYYFLYSLFALLLAAGYFLTEVKEGIIEKNKFIWLLTAGLILALLLLILVGFDKGSIIYHLRNHGAHTAFKNLSYSQSYTLALVIGIVFIGVVLYLVFLQKINTIAFTSILIGEILLVACMSLFMHGTSETPAAINTFIHQQGKHFRQPPFCLNTNEQLIPKLPKGIWRNYHIYFNAVSPDFFNSFFTRNILALDSTHELLNILYAQPLIQHDSSTSLKIKAFYPGEIELEVQAKNQDTLYLQQLNSPWWNLYIDKARYKLPNENILTCVIPNGQHTIQFKFNNYTIVYAFWLSLIITAFLFCVSLLLFIHPPLKIAVASLFIIIFTLSLIWFKSAEQPNLNTSIDCSQPN